MAKLLNLILFFIFITLSNSRSSKPRHRHKSNKHKNTKDRKAAKSTKRHYVLSNAKYDDYDNYGSGGSFSMSYSDSGYDAHYDYDMNHMQSIPNKGHQPIESVEAKDLIHNPSRDTLMFGDICYCRTVAAADRSGCSCDQMMSLSLLYLGSETVSHIKIYDAETGHHRHRCKFDNVESGHELVCGTNNEMFSDSTTLHIQKTDGTSCTGNVDTSCNGNSVLDDTSDGCDDIVVSGYIAQDGRVCDVYEACACDEPSAVSTNVDEDTHKNKGASYYDVYDTNSHSLSMSDSLSMSNSHSYSDSMSHSMSESYDGHSGGYYYYDGGDNGGGGGGGGGGGKPTTTYMPYTTKRIITGQLLMGPQQAVDGPVSAADSADSIPYSNSISGGKNRAPSEYTTGHNLIMYGPSDAPPRDAPPSDAPPSDAPPSDAPPHTIVRDIPAMIPPSTIDDTNPEDDVVNAIVENDIIEEEELPEPVLSVLPSDPVVEIDSVASDDVVEIDSVSTNHDHDVVDGLIDNAYANGDGDDIANEDGLIENEEGDVYEEEEDKVHPEWELPVVPLRNKEESKGGPEDALYAVYIVIAALVVNGLMFFYCVYGRQMIKNWRMKQEDYTSDVPSVTEVESSVSDLESGN